MNRLEQHILRQIEMEWAHIERMNKHRERMKHISFALAYSKSVEAFPLRTFGEVVFVSMN